MGGLAALVCTCRYRIILRLFRPFPALLCACSVWARLGVYLLVCWMRRHVPAPVRPWQSA